MYKDKDKQRQANKEAAQRRRDKTKGMTKTGMTPQGMTQGIDVETGIATVVTASTKGDVMTIEKIERIKTALPDGEYIAKGKITQAEIDALPEDVKAAIAREPEDEHQVRTERAVRYNRLFGQCIEPGADLELCKYCSKPLPKLEKPRIYTGACLPCVMANN